MLLRVQEILKNFIGLFTFFPIPPQDFPFVKLFCFHPFFQGGRFSSPNSEQHWIFVSLYPDWDRPPRLKNLTVFGSKPLDAPGTKNA